MLSSRQIKAPKQTVPRNRFQLEEDARLITLLQQNPFPSWESIAKEFENRTARQCRERWQNYLSPQVRIGSWSLEEEEFLVQMVRLHGHSWSAISRMFQGRSENDIKNRWYSHLQKVVKFDGWQGTLDRSLLLKIRTDRKKRNRPVVDPKRNALQLLEMGYREDAVPEVGSRLSELAQSSQIESILSSEPDNQDALDGMETLDSWVGFGPELEVID